MAVDRKKLEAIIGGRARAMCTPEFDKTLDSYGGKTSLNESYDPSPSYYDADADKFDAMYSASFNNSDISKSNVEDMGYTNESVMRSNLPNHIKESLITERIDVKGSGGISILDSMSIPQATPRKKIAEQHIPPTQNTSNVDYSIIKAIVNECLNEHLSKQILNESTTLQTIALKEGTISLVDNKGNIYKAKLEKIGNKNDKK